MSPCIHCHDVVSRSCSVRCSLSCQEHLRDDIETGSGWSYGGPDETAGSVSLSWNEFQTFELAARTNESSVWGHWENMRSMRSSRLHSFSDLMIPASIFDVGTTGMRDDDTHLAKVFSPGHNHFMAPSGIESEFSTELGSNRSPISCRQLETLGGGPGRCSEQPSSVRCAKASSQLQQSLASSTNRWSGIPVLEVSGRKKDVLSSDPGCSILHDNTELPIYYLPSSLNPISKPFTVKDDPSHLLPQLLDSLALHEDILRLDDRVNDLTPSQLPPCLQPAEYARMRCSIIPAKPQSVFAEISFNNQNDPLLPLTVFDVAQKNTKRLPLDGAKELPLDLNRDLPNSIVTTLPKYTDSDLSWKTTEEGTASFETSCSSKVVCSWNDGLSAQINKPPPSAGVPSTSYAAQNCGLVDRKLHSCHTRDKTQAREENLREAVSSQEKHSCCKEMDGKIFNKQVRKRRVAKAGGTLPFQVYRYHASPNNLNLPLHNLDNLFYLDIAIEEDVYFRYMGRIVIKTIPDVAPRMSENFAILCERRTQSYRGCNVFQCWVGQSILTGDTSGRHGRGGEGAYGGNFLPDQNDLSPFHGAVAMRRYRKGFSCHGHVGSQFRIFLTKHLHMGGIFGVVVSGLDVAHALGNLGDRWGRPTRNAIIAECGRLDVE